MPFLLQVIPRPLIFTAENAGAMDAIETHVSVIVSLDIVTAGIKVATGMGNRQAAGCKAPEAQRMGEVQETYDFSRGAF